MVVAYLELVAMFCRTRGHFFGQGDILSDKGTFCRTRGHFCRTRGHFVGQGDIFVGQGDIFIVISFWPAVGRGW